MGLLQGICFTIVPGASIFLTSSQGFALSSQEYGQLFIPMIVMAIFSSFWGGKLAKSWGIRRVSVVSCILNFFSMAIFAMSVFFMHDGFWILLISLFLIGAGFGSNLATLNSYVLEFFPRQSSSALTALHATLGIGTAIGPVFFQFAKEFMDWWMAPLILALGYLLLFFLCLSTFPLHLQLLESSASRIKKGVFLFFAIAILYGICETAFGNWGILYLKKVEHVPNELASLSLSFFWASVTLGRVISAILGIWIQPKWIYASIGIILIGSLFLLKFPVLAFVVAGLGCSAFLPLTVSLAQKIDLPNAEAISGFVISLYMLGYGISAYGIGLFEMDLLKKLFSWLLIPASLICILALISFRSKESERSL